MDTAGLEERLVQRAPEFERMAPILVAVFSLVTLVLAGHLYASPPTFQTDLNDFAPSSDASLAHDRIHAYFPDEMRPLFVHVTADDGSNVLALEAIHAMADHSPNGQAQSHGLMVNYVYDLDDIEANHFALNELGTVAASKAVIALADEGRALAA